ncbi:uncharacterized protein [Physcomitrium patens]|uniref:HMA domain-containing protein n=1 Tax=Physcomitrium patens TaxID=3218 RepID=A0A2K1IEI9_PHYPA|nr:uncharacterized protein LOC112277240 [Physcomitrium patens]PNR27692.1 hypothetical protein PHYPA_029844 [Physcomitrium patens]|eukprot:XP_024365112.1 uncharacterized protein LOC112277240 [Physcomitrella patens]
MSLNEVFYSRGEPEWLHQRPPAYGYGGNSPRTELRVLMCCHKCEEKVREEINEVYGVEDIFTDQGRSEVAVYGYADSHDVLKKARKIDKRAEIVSSDSFTLHHGKPDKHRKHRTYHQRDKHNRSFLPDYNPGHAYAHLPTEVSSARYNSSLNQSSTYDSRSYNRHPGSSYGIPGYEHRHHDYRPDHDNFQPEYRHIRRGYRLEPETIYRYNDYQPDFAHQSLYGGYQPNQNYPPSYVDRRDYRDPPYPEAIANPDYMKQNQDYYY